MQLTPNTTSVSRKWLYALILAAAMAPQVYKLLLPQAQMFASMFSDDCFYYYKTALNIRNEFGSTFDTINFTNGYHPLWMLICVGLAFITTDIHTYLYIVFAVNLLFVFLLSVQILRMFKPRLGFWFCALLLFMINWQRKTSGAVFSGLETPLYVLLVLLSVEVMVKISWRDKTQLLLLGILLGLSFLARTSFVLFFPVFAAYVIFKLVRKRPIDLFKVIVYVGGPAVVLACPYLVWNFHTTGHFEQISGLVKNLQNCGGFESPNNFIAALSTFTQYLPIILKPRPLTIIPVLLLCLCAWTIVSRRLYADFLRDHRIVLLSIFGLISFVYYFIAYGTITRLWHLATAWIVFDIVFIAALKITYDLVSAKKLTKVVVLVMMIAMATNAFFHVWIYRHKFPLVEGRPENVTQRHKMTVWMRDNLPHDSRIGVWNAGYIGYFSGHKIINLDGLINGVELYDYLKDDRGVWNYIIDNRIDYIADYFYTDPAPPMRSALKNRLKEVYHSAQPVKSPTANRKVVNWYVWQIEYED